MIVEFPARVIFVPLIVVKPVPVVKVFEPAIVAFPSNVIPDDPLFIFIAVAPVVFPMVIVFALAFVPILIDPVVSESRLRAPVVPAVILRSFADADVRARVLSDVIEVGPTPESVAPPAAIPNRCTLFVRKSKPKLSVDHTSTVSP
jgi:hypothetical protein